MWFMGYIVYSCESCALLSLAIMGGTCPKAMIRNGQGRHTEVWRPIRLCSESERLLLPRFPKEK